MKIKAELKNYRQSSRKVRLVADLVRGKKVEKALAELNFLNKKASLVVKKLVNSAVANAKHNFNLEKDVLIVDEIRVDEGPTLKRWRAGARGRAFPIKKRTSRVLLVLSDGKEDVKTEKEQKKTETKPKTKKTTRKTAKKVVKKTEKMTKKVKKVKKKDEKVKK